jgi:hypothetical protein
MKKILTLTIMSLTFGFANAQSGLNLSNKTFLMEDKISSSTELYFNSKDQVTYLITNVIKGKTYIDKCIGKATISDNKISINCTCDDKELYPDPISDSFIYDSKSQTLTSTKYTYVSEGRKYVIWNLK